MIGQVLPKLKKKEERWAMEILSLGEKIKRKRKELDMTLKDLAGDRITPGQISLVESGRSNPSMDLLEYLAQALKTSVEYLMESEETQAEKICSYYEQVAESYILADEIILAEKFIEKALNYADKYNLNYRKAKNLFLRAEAYMFRGELVLAQEFFLAANVIFIKEDSYEDSIKTFLHLGKITLELKAFHSAISYLQQAEKIYNKHNIGDDFILGEIYFYMANIYFNIEDLKSAMMYSNLAKEKLEKIYNKKQYAKSLLILAEEYNSQGNLNNAIKFSKKSLNIYKEIQNLEDISKIENKLGKIYYQFEDLQESFKHYEIAKELRIKKKDKDLINTLANICENFIKLKNINSCTVVLDEMKKYVDKLGPEAIIEYNLLNFRLSILKEEFEEAEMILKETLNLTKETDNLKKSGEIAITLGKFYLDRRDDLEASKYLDEGIKIFKQLEIIKN